MGIQHIISFNGTIHLTTLKNEERPDDWYVHFIYGYLNFELKEAETEEDIIIAYPSIPNEFQTFWDVRLSSALKILNLPVATPKFNYIIDNYEPLIGEID